MKYQSICKMLWNMVVSQREDYWSKAVTHGPDSYKKEFAQISEYGQSKQLTQLKRENEFMYDVPSGMLCNVLTMVDQSYQMFFRNLKKNPKAAGKPRYKGKKDSIGLKFKDSKSYSVLKLSGDNYSKIKLEKLGSVRFREHEPIKGKIKNCMIKKEVDGWYLVCAVDHEIKCENNSESSIGLDMGVAHTITTSAGQHIDLPKYISDAEERVVILQRRMRNKKRGSSNSRKEYTKIAKLKAKIARQKDYFLKMTAHDLTTNNRVIGVEKLNIQNMTRSASGTLAEPGKNVAQKRGLNRSILSNNWGFFFSKLEEMGKQNGCEIIYVNPKNTSRKCSGCGCVHADNRKTQELFTCVSCGLEMNADVNAAINIKHLALAGVEPVEMLSLDKSKKQECTKKQVESDTYVA